MIRYGLREISTGELLTFSTTSNESETGTDIEFQLDSYRDPVWMVETRDKAEYVRNNQTEWFNAGYDTPSHQYHPDELKVVRFDISVNVGT